MNQDIENIIKKNLPDKRHHIDFDFDNVHSCPCGGTTTGCRLCRAEMCDNPNCKLGKGKDYTDEEIKSFNYALSKIDTSLIADEVLKVVVETTSKEIQKELDAGGFYRICSNETTFKAYVIGLLSEHLSTNKENKNNG